MQQQPVLLNAQRGEEEDKVPTESTKIKDHGADFSLMGSVL